MKSQRDQCKTLIGMMMSRKINQIQKKETYNIISFQGEDIPNPKKKEKEKGEDIPKFILRSFVQSYQNQSSNNFCFFFSNFYIYIVME